MLEAFRNFEKIAHDFAPQVLVVPGLLCVVLGLCLWLGGLRWSRPTALILGILAGCLWAFFLTTRQTAAFVSMAVVAGVFAAFFNRAALVVAGVATAIMITLIIYAAPFIKINKNRPYPASKISTVDQRAAKNITLAQESLEVAKTQLVFLGDKFARAVNLIPFEKFAIPAIVGLVVGVMGYFMPQLISDLSCAALGTAITFCGMILLLLHKGAQPITHIYARASIYNTALLAMVVFGSAVQMMLCSARDKKMAAKVLSRGEL